jgi:hypothetical protein
MVPPLVRGGTNAVKWRKDRARHACPYKLQLCWYRIFGGAIIFLFLRQLQDSRR